MKQFDCSVKYCGGCHPYYDRRKFAGELEAILGHRLEAAVPGHCYDAIFVLNGCSAQCVDCSALTAKQFIKVNSSSHPAQTILAAAGIRLK